MSTAWNDRDIRQIMTTIFLRYRDSLACVDRHAEPCQNVGPLPALDVATMAAKRDQEPLVNHPLTDKGT